MTRPGVARTSRPVPRRALAAPTRICLAVVAVAVAGCGAGSIDLGGSVGPNDWHLVEVAPDDRTLLVTSTYGGVASDCARWEDWVVDATSERLSIEARLWRRRLPSGCTDDGAARSLRVVLDEPLGDRELVGCGHDDCQELVVDDEAGTVATVRDLGDGVVVARADELAVLDADGRLRWERTGATWRVQVGEDVVATTAEVDEVVAFDIDSGEVRWEGPGVVVGSTGDLLLVCRALDDDLELEGGGALVGRWASTGAVAWEVEDVPCEPVARAGDDVVVVAGDEDVDGGLEVLAIDGARGDVVARRPIPDGVDDRVAAWSGLVSTGTGVVVGGDQGDLVVLDARGDERRRWPDVRGRPVGALGELVLVHDDRGRLSGVDVATGSVAWSRDVGDVRVEVSEDVVVVAGGPDGAVVLLDPGTGDVRWSVPLRSSGAALGTSGGGDTIVVVSALATTALDTDTGEVTWSVPVGPGAEDVVDLSR